ncbi:MAG: response regulator [Candidatus Omnitrophica bacterium]|nr:response regulator [Candidatus Omnitrophota bacterium]
MKGPILIADTDEHFRDSLKKILADQYPLIIVESPLQALKIVGEKRKPSLILMGIDESETDEGDNIFAAIRKQEPDILLIALGDRTAENDAIEAVRLGATGYMIKPLNTSEVLSIAAKHAGG